MARYSYVVLTRAIDGREDELAKWYEQRHLVDVRAVPGVVGARHFRILRQQAGELDARWTSLAVYELETDDPDAVLRTFAERAGTDAMPFTGALDTHGMLSVLGEPSMP